MNIRKLAREFRKQGSAPTIVKPGREYMHIHPRRIRGRIAALQALV